MRGGSDGAEGSGAPPHSLKHPPPRLLCFAVWDAASSPAADKLSRFHQALQTKKKRGKKKDATVPFII